MYLQANIGRNVSNVPMSDSVWRNFEIDVTNDLALAVASLTGAPVTDILAGDFERHMGVGTWDGVDADEESLHISIVVPLSDVTTAPPVTASIMTGLVHDLQYRAEQYGQEAIALITTSKLIRPKTRR